ncbi:hypothetical protein IWZ03DRAFT_372649 [Phyllosticta citriasiana]|uniref:Secreted protein n=1 Tax=Phyllosticta citriasiana TaxID=595635 RepID=A0ABR1KRX9_9PEZI
MLVVLARLLLYCSIVCTLLDSSAPFLECPVATLESSDPQACLPVSPVLGSAAADLAPNAAHGYTSRLQPSPHLLRTAACHRAKSAPSPFPTAVTTNLDLEVASVLS